MYYRTEQTMQTFLLTPSVVLSLLLVPVQCDMPEITVCTYNLWNVMFSWEVRLRHIADMVSQVGCEVVVLQEVRIRGDESWSQAHHLARLLPHFRWVVTHVAGLVSISDKERTRPSYLNDWEKEGLAVLSQWPVGETSAWPLSSHHGPDTNKRIALHVPVLITPETTLHIVAVHFSYDRQQQCQNAADVQSYIKELKNTYIVLAGDFNAYPDFPHPVTLFTQNSGSLRQVLQNPCTAAKGYAPKTVPFVDAWLASHGPDDAGLTFSNMPTPGAVSRPDRLLASNSFMVLNASLHGSGTAYVENRHIDIILHRLWVILKSAKAAALGHAGYSCLQDCGPNGQCRCGVCVKEGDQCQLPDCQECSPIMIFKFCLFAACATTLLALTCTAAVRVLVISARFEQSATFQILGCTCCLCNPRLLTEKTCSPRHFVGRHMTRIGLGRLPPAILFFLCFSALGLCLLVAMFELDNMLQTASNIMPEERYPSDHLMLTAKLRMKPVE